MKIIIKLKKNRNSFPQAGYPKGWIAYAMMILLCNFKLTVLEYVVNKWDYSSKNL